MERYVGVSLLEREGLLLVARVPLQSRMRLLRFAAASLAMTMEIVACSFPPLQGRVRLLRSARNDEEDCGLLLSTFARPCEIASLRCRSARNDGVDSTSSRGAERPRGDLPRPCNDSCNNTNDSDDELVKFLISFALPLLSQSSSVSWPCLQK